MNTSRRVELLSCATIALVMLCGLLSVGGYFATMTSATARKSARLIIKQAPGCVTPILVVAVGLVVLYALARIASLYVDVRTRNAQRDVIRFGDGQPPLVGQGRAVYDPMTPAVRAVSMLTAGHAQSGLKMSAASVRSAIHAVEHPPSWASAQQADDAAWRPAPAAPAVRPFDVNEIDLVRNPHFLFGGKTGSGKTTAIFSVTEQLARRHHIEFVIVEPGGTNWKNRANAIDLDGIVDTVADVHAIMMQRQAILRASTANHVLELPDPPPYIGFVVEEAESVYADLKVRERQPGQAKSSQAMALQLRQLAAMGRKTGICMFFGTQTALRVIFDGAVLENISNIYLFGAMPQLAERFRVSRDANLPGLRVGQAYAVANGDTLQFPRAALPALLASSEVAFRTGTPPPPRLTTVQPVHTAAEAVDVPPSWANIVSAETVRQVYQVYRATGQSQLKTTQRAIWPDREVGGYWFYWLREVVRHAEGLQPHPDAPFTVLFEDGQS